MVGLMNRNIKVPRIESRGSGEEFGAAHLTGQCATVESSGFFSNPHCERGTKRQLQGKV